MTKRTRNRIILISGLSIVVLITYCKPFSKTQITVLDHLTQKINDSVVHQVCLVENPPYLSYNLKCAIDKYNRHETIDGKYYVRLFVKDHSFSILSSLDYHSTEITREDIATQDLLAKSKFHHMENEPIRESIKCFTGEEYYYEF